MALYMEALTPPFSPFKKSFVPRDVVHLHNVPSSAETPTTITTTNNNNNSNADACWDGCWLDLLWALPEQTQYPLLTPVTPTRQTTQAAATADPTSQSSHPPIRRRPSLINPRVDIEGNAPKVCPCCHMRCRSSTNLRSPKYIHNAFDECCGDFCPDLVLSQSHSGPTSHPNIGHSGLCNQL